MQASVQVSTVEIVFFFPLTLPFVLSKSVPVDLLQVLFEFMLQRVDEQDVSRLFIHQLRGTRDWSQEGQETEYSTVMEVLQSQN